MDPSLRIFVVENNDDTRDMLQLLLERLGHRVATAASVEGALAGLRDERYDMLLSDIGLPDGTGWQLLARLTDAERPPFSVAMSGFASDEDRRHSLAAGFRRHLVKPLQLDQLLELLVEGAEERARKTGVERPGEQV